ncbi:MAG: NADAR family protein [Acaryochloridaceae cyanobacterium RL_2_7]|nr:NADAR family protein [Acaryochloridaceae cyanobacterium RL_2_7]
MTIYFYKVQEQYGCFSNFSPHSIVMGAVQWPTSEHYYQAQKFIGTEDEAVICEQIRPCPSPEQAAALGRDRIRVIRPDWDQTKDQVMYEAVKTKFSSHPEICSVLLATGSEEIVEDSPNDYYWGCGADKTGENHLGKILMRVREELRLA